MLPKLKKYVEEFWRTYVLFLAPILFLPGVNLTKILQAAFLNKMVFQSFSLLTVWLCNFLAKEYGRKSYL